MPFHSRKIQAAIGTWKNKETSRLIFHGSRDCFQSSYKPETQENEVDVANSETEKQEEKKGNDQPQVILIAHLQAQLVSGETLKLLPIRHENDVKSDVTKLLEEWAKSGFLLRGNVAYPWHQVKSVEVTEIEELAPHEVHQRMLLLEGAERAQMQQGFWKTRETKGDQDKDKKGEEDKKGSDEKKE